MVDDGWARLPKLRSDVFVLDLASWRREGMSVLPDAPFLIGSALGRRRADGDRAYG
jgi:hypothetical protein